MGAPPLPEPKGAAPGPLSGIWRSRYEYPSSGRGKTYASQHYLVILHRGRRLQLRSLPGTADGRVMMDLNVNGQVVTGTRTEQTDSSGYYQGSVYSGGIQFILEPTGHRMASRWIGYGRDFEINDGPWTLDAGTGHQRHWQTSNGQVQPAGELKLRLNQSPCYPGGSGR